MFKFATLPMILAYILAPNVGLAKEKKAPPREPTMFVPKEDFVILLGACKFTGTNGAGELKTFDEPAESMLSCSNLGQKSGYTLICSETQDGAPIHEKYIGVEMIDGRIGLINQTQSQNDKFVFDPTTHWAGRSVYTYNASPPILGARVCAGLFYYVSDYKREKKKIADEDAVAKSH